MASTPTRVTPSAASEHSPELLGCPISVSLATCCVRLELRSLPSTSVTRLQRYCEPLRHPRAPGLSVTGVRLVVPDHALGLPVLPALSLCTCCRHYPGAATGRPTFAHPSRRVSLPRIWQPGRPAHRPFRGLLGVHSRCGLHTRAVTEFVTRFTRRLQPFRYLHDCSGCFRLEHSPGGIRTHWKAPPYHGARQVLGPCPAVRSLALIGGTDDDNRKCGQRVLQPARDRRCVPDRVSGMIVVR